MLNLLGKAYTFLRQKRKMAKKDLQEDQERKAAATRIILWDEDYSVAPPFRRADLFLLERWKARRKLPLKKPSSEA